MSPRTPPLLLVALAGLLVCLVADGSAQEVVAADEAREVETTPTTVPRGIYVEAVEAVRPAIVGVHGQEHGAGVVISADGLVLTSSRVVDVDDLREIDHLEVLLDSGRLVEAEPVGTDAAAGVSLVRMRGVEGHAFVEAEPNVEDPLPGETVITLSNATGIIFRDYQPATAIGHVYSVLPLHIGRRHARRAIEISGLAAGSGVAGGGVFDLQGRLRGMLTGGFRQGVFLGQAVPAADIFAAVDSILRGADARTATGAYLGAGFTEPMVEGLAISRLEDESPLAAAGLEIGDILLAIAGKPVASPRDVDEILLAVAPRATVEMLVRRDGELVELELETAEPPAPGFLGVTWQDDDQTGLLVAETTDPSPIKLRKGDRVLEINEFPVNDLADLERLQPLLHIGAEVRVAVQRGNGRRTLLARLRAEPEEPSEDEDGDEEAEEPSEEEDAPEQQPGEEDEEEDEDERP